MSKSDIQTQTILAVATGAIITVEENGMAANEMPAIVYAREVSNECYRKYPETGNPSKNAAAVFNHCYNLREKLDAASDKFSPLILISISQLLMTDLMEKVKDKNKLKLLEPVSEAIDGIHNLLDPDGKHIDVYEEAEKLCNYVKEEIGFVLHK